MIVGKFILQSVDRQVVKIPLPAKILSVIEQHGEIVMYALMCKDAPTVPKTIDIYGTGHDVRDKRTDFCDGLSEPGIFIGTVSTENGSLIWHVFDGSDCK
jgi:hypothetical protein